MYLTLFFIYETFGNLEHMYTRKVLGGLMYTCVPNINRTTKYFATSEPKLHQFKGPRKQSTRIFINDWLVLEMKCVYKTFHR
jgi:hypothetical protein